MLEFNRKPERIASALYLITSFFDDREPIKWKLRVLASDLISLEVLIRDNFIKEREVKILEIKNLVMEMTDLLRVARNVGLISEINHSLLQQELVKFSDSMTFSTDMLEKGRTELVDNFFDIENREVSVLPKKEEVSLKDKSTDKSFNYSRVLPSGISAPSMLKGQKLKVFGAVSVKKNTRQSIIISILKRKREIMIKDVSPLINGCSEKTIQRELMAMVKAGILKKVGEKRWSRYSLA